MQEPNDLDKFINEILLTKGLSLPNDEVCLQLVSDLKKRLIEQINRALIAALPEDKMSELNTALEKTEIEGDEIRNIIENSGIDTKTITVKTMLKFRGLYLETPLERGA